MEQSKKRRNHVWFNKYGYVNIVNCYLCKNQLTFRKATVDHLVARSLGGSDDLNNLDIACQKCNNRKSEIESRLVSMLRRCVGDNHAKIYLL